MSEDEKKKSDNDSISIANPIIWIVGTVVLLLVGWFAAKILLFSGEEYKVSLVDAPKEAFSGSTTTFTWRIDGSPATINRTVVFLGTTSNPGELGKEVKPADTKYTEYVKDFDNGKYDIPLQFIGNIKIGNPGTYYYRVYAAVKDKNYWSDEYTMDVKQKNYGISVLSAPNEASAGAATTFTWTVDGPASVIDTTSVRYGPASNPGVLGEEITPKETKYTEFLKDFINGEYTIPLQFIGNLKFTYPGKYYYRFHTLIQGRNYWTDEYTITVR